MPRTSPRTLVFVAAGLALSAVFLWLAVRNADLAVVWDKLQEADLMLVLLAVLVLGFGYAFQASRWRRIANVRLGLAKFYAMVLTGLACNNVLPVRVGELVRARLLSRDAPMPGGRALGTVALDRMFDVIALALFLAVGVTLVTSPGWLIQLAAGALIALMLIVGVLVFARVYTLRRTRERRERRVLRRVIRDVIELLAEPMGRRNAALWTGLSIVTWTLGALAVYLVARSLGIALSPVEAVFVTAVLNLGVAIPSSPGYVGTYQWLGVSSLGLLDVPVNDALAFAIVMQASWYVPTTLAGGVVLAHRALRRPRFALGPSPSSIDQPSE